MQLKFLTLILFFSTEVLGNNWLPQPPTNEQLSTMMEKLVVVKKEKDADEIQNKKYENIVNAAKKEFNQEHLSLAQIEGIIVKNGMLYGVNALRKLVYPALTKLMKDKTLEGAKAAGLLITNFPIAANNDTKDYKQNLKWAEFYKSFLRHPAIVELMQMNDNSASDIFGRLQFLNPKAIATSGLIDAFTPLFDKPMSHRAASSVFIVFKIASDKETKTSEEKLEFIRQKSVDAIDRALSKNTVKSDDILFSRRAYLDGASAKGKLIGNKAPVLEFNWLNQGTEKNLEAFKGKVVVLDFWAVWCSPCIASFPNVKKLQEYYAGYPVEIISVTSLQGYNFEMSNEGRKKIDAKNNPALEYSLMPQFIKHYDMTWKVAYTKQEEFNPEYGVTGIPHVAIIDPAGIVRYNQLRPYHAPYLEAEKIDALLKEFNLPTPPKPMEKINYSSVKD